MILVCDHRGRGLARLVDPLRAAGLLTALSTSPRETLARLVREQPEVCVLDPLAPTGEVELEALEGGPGRPAPALLWVAAEADLAAAVRALRRLGAHPADLCRLDAPVEELILRIERLRNLARDRGEYAELRHRAAHDDRTELLRPRTFQARLVEHFGAARRHRFELALVLLDLDDFGRVNKEIDHTAGDRVIARVGEVIRRSLRAEDVAGRLGGDEFAVLLPYTGPIDAAHAVRRLAERIRALSGPLGPQGRQVRVSASLGFETFDGVQPEGIEELRLRAERALRVAKRAGGDRGVWARSLEH